MRLFDVKDDWTAFFPVFSCDFTKAFEFTLVLSFLSRQKKKKKEKWGRENETEPWPKPFLSFWSLFKKTKQQKKKLVMDSGQTPGCATIHGKTDFESRKPDLMLLKPERLEA